jgi:hypothetical protein
VPSKVFDVDFAGQLSQLGAAASLKRIIITRLTPERLPVLARVLRACQQADLQLLMTNAALQLLNERAAADEALAAALKGVQIEVLNRGSEVQLSGGRPLRFIPIPTPRWPDLVAVYSETGGRQGGREGSCMLLAGRKAGSKHGLKMLTFRLMPACPCRQDSVQQQLLLRALCAHPGPAAGQRQRRRRQRRGQGRVCGLWFGLALLL